LRAIPGTRHSAYVPLAVTPYAFTSRHYLLQAIPRTRHNNYYIWIYTVSTKKTKPTTF